jgi:hypothetical protein
MPFNADGQYFNGPCAFTQVGTEQRALERGQGIEVAPPDVLQIDIDGPEAYERFSASLNIWQTCPTLPALGKIVERSSRTEGHKHITIELPTEYGIEHRIMLQALLGSDIKREILSLASYYNGHETPIVFYRPLEECNAASQQARPRNGADGSTDVSDAGGRNAGSGRDAGAGNQLHRRRRRRRSNPFTSILPADDEAFTF